MSKFNYEFLRTVGTILFLFGILKFFLIFIFEKFQNIKKKKPDKKILSKFFCQYTENRLKRLYIH